MAVLVYTEQVEGQFKKSALEVVSYAKAIAKDLNTQLAAISIGDASDEVLKTLGDYGADKILAVRDKNLNAFSNEAYSATIAEAAIKENANLVILSNSFSGKGLAPSISIKLKAAIAAGAVDLPKIEGDKFIIKKPAFSGKAFAFLELLSAKKVISLNPNSYSIVESPTNAIVEEFSINTDLSRLKTSVKEVLRSTNKVSLPDAEIVVSGGRGL